jgi:hypothetical protein
MEDFAIDPVPCDLNNFIRKAGGLAIWLSPDFFAVRQVIQGRLQNSDYSRTIFNSV